MIWDNGRDQHKPLLLCHNNDVVNDGKGIRDERLITNNKDYVQNHKRCTRLISSDQVKRKDSSCSSSINNGSGSKVLSRKLLSQYYYMPITKAAKELNVGLTLLKKRCRELGIRRWPHRKLMSLQTLIKNVQELGNGDQEGKVEDVKIKNAVKLLEREKKIVEEIPDAQLGNTTKRLRQACFKANYKKRKLQSMITTDSDIEPRLNKVSTMAIGATEDDGDNNEELKFLLFDDHPFYSSTNLLEF